MEQLVPYTKALASVDSTKNFPVTLRSKTMKVGMNAKLAVRIAVLAVVMVGTFMAATVQPVPAADGGPLILCPPKTANCSTNLPTLRS